MPDGLSVRLAVLRLLPLTVAPMVPHTSSFAAMCVPERTLQDQVTGHHDNDDMYMTFATHVFNKGLEASCCCTACAYGLMSSAVEVCTYIHVYLQGT